MKIKATNKIQEYSIIKCKCPKMSDVKGATWDNYKTISLNGKYVNMYCDTSWGIYFYFVFDGQWYKIRYFQNLDYVKDIESFASVLDDNEEFVLI